jgi:uncharacterized protein
MVAHLDTVLVKTASRCNLDCSYCYVYQGGDTSWKQQPKKMSVETIYAICHRLIEQANEQVEGFAIVLHGGEPLLLGYDKTKLLLDKLRSELGHKHYPISIQTNGVLLSSKFLDLFSSKKVSVSVSLDGTQSANDIARIDHLGRSTFAETVKGIKLLSAHPDSEFLFAGTLSVIQPSIPPRKIYDFLKELNTPSMDFLMQDGNHDELPIGKKSFESTEYGMWLSKLLDIYLSDPKPVEIPVLDDLIKLCIGGASVKEGRGKDAFGILIIETNGEIRKNDTLRTSYDGADYFSKRKNIESTSISDIVRTEEFHASSQLQFPTAKKCMNCSLLNICGGGMPLYRWSSDNGYKNPSVYCSDHQYLIKNITDHLGITKDQKYVS